MTDSVEKVPLSSVQETSSSKSKDVDELDLDDFSDSNIIVRGEKSAEEVEFAFSNIKSVSGLSSDEIRQELKSLKNKPIQDVTVEFDGKKGRLALENINIGESSDTLTYHEGSISGRFLPWPKHFTSNPPTIYTILTSDSLYVLDIESGIGVLVGVSSSSVFDFSSTGDIGQLRSVSSNVSPKLSFFDDVGYGENYGGTYSTSDVTLNLILSLIGDVGGDLDLSDKISLILSLSSTSNYSIDISSSLTLLVQLSSTSSYTGSVQGSLSSLVSTSGLIASATSISSDLSQLQSVNSSTSYQGNLSGDVAGKRAVSSSLSFTNTLSSVISELLSLSSTLNVNAVLTGNLEFSSVAYGSKYGSDYGFPSNVVYGEQYGSAYGSPAEYGAGYGSDYSS